MKIRTRTNIGALVPDKLYTKLRYSKTGLTLVELNPASRTCMTQLLANTLHQPEQGGTAGHQYLLHDTWKQLYGLYRVLASKIEIWVINTTGAAGNAGTISICAKKEATIDNPITLDEGHALEDPRWKTRIVNPTTAKGLYMSAYCKTKNVLGYTGDNFPHTAYSAFDSSPTEDWYWHIASNDFSAGASTLNIIVRLTAYCEFSQRANLVAPDAAPA